MSKNVAVFVDVANIFYAAKAAGVDIDYVTLLKTSTAGRDFVRAYAYTGLDPDNENQRQFHQFLARHGYRVVSKDIRKYGDGKVKANLDIELVVDLMKTARNLDIAVVVSGDGDFAPAIRAVQEMGVRVEVVSFRGNTSSDLIEVADLFTDITQIAKVEKASSRSGRRVASDDDLSMTAVPDKESEGAPRRRGGRGRGRTSEREAAEPTVRAGRREGGADGNGAAPGGPSLVALPGERLSRVGPAASGEPTETAFEEGTVEEGEAVDAGLGTDEAGGRRRRRRRGGRGRGRGRGGERAGLPQSEDAVEEDEGLEPLAPAPRLPHSTPFGSIWDSQLGVASGPLLAGEELEEALEDEPEIPEYLLAERRQQRGVPRGPGVRGGQRGGRGRGRGGAYQAALDRERFGRGAGGGGGQSPFGTGQRRPVQPPRGRPDRAPRPFVENTGSGDLDPWSEVPPEIEAMLRAELARRPADGARPSGPATPEEREPRRQVGPAAQSTTSGTPERGRGRRVGARRTSSPEGVAAAADLASRAAPTSPLAEPESAAPMAGDQAPDRATRGRPRSAAPAKPAVSAAAKAAPKRTRTSPRPPAAAATSSDGGPEEPPAKPKRTPATRKTSTSDEA